MQIFVFILSRGKQISCHLLVVIQDVLLKILSKMYFLLLQFKLAVVTTVPSCGQNGAVAMWSRQQVPVKSLSHVIQSFFSEVHQMHKNRRMYACLHIQSLI